MDPTESHSEAQGERATHVVRDGLDPSVALAAAFARHKAHVALNGPDRPTSSAGSSALFVPGSPRPHLAARIKAKARAATHRAAARGLRAVRPAALPLLGRLRSFMTDPLRHELLVELRQSAEESRAQLAALRAEIRTASRGAVEASSVEIRAVGASLRGDLRVAEEAAAQRLGAATELVDAGISALRPILERTEVYSSSAARRIAVPANPGTVLVRATPGYVLCAVDDVALLASLMEAGELEPGTRSLIERFLHPGDVFVDVGANLGLHTIAAARRLSGNGRVVAIEPFPDTARLLERTIWLNGFSAICEVKQLALSDSAGEQELYLGPTSGHHSLYPLEGGPGQEARSVEVPVARLDDLLAPDDRVDLMKIDVEGAELAVIGGATGVLSQNPDIALVVEFGPSHLARVGVPSEDWLATFDRLGFTWRAINPDTGVLEERSIADLEADESTNLFFARPASEAWSRVSS